MTPLLRLTRLLSDIKPPDATQPLVTVNLLGQVESPIDPINSKGAMKPEILLTQPHANFTTPMAVTHMNANYQSLPPTQQANTSASGHKRPLVVNPLDSPKTEPKRRRVIKGSLQNCEQPPYI